LKVVAFFGDGVPRYTKRLSDAVNSREVIMEHRGNWVQYRLRQGPEENEVIHPLNCRIDFVEF